jgi:hypothetical protein
MKTINMNRKNGLRTAGILFLALGLLAGGCGGQDDGSQDTTREAASNLTAACGKLTTQTCTLNPKCQLKKISCVTPECVCAGCQPGMTCLPCNCPTPQPVCTYDCVPKLTCEKITNEKSCVARTDCSWGQFICPDVACKAGQACPSSPSSSPSCPFTCASKPPKTCSLLNELSCKARKDCVWGQIEVCSMTCAPGAACTPCTPICSPVLASQGA